VLQAILSDFNGTILLVSHDRYLIDALATQIWEVIPDQSRCGYLPGLTANIKMRARCRPSAAESMPIQT
jgi:ATP-binding cassette, subfamily F, member 3